MLKVFVQDVQIAVPVQVAKLALVRSDPSRQGLRDEVSLAVAVQDPLAATVTGTWRMHFASVDVQPPVTVSSLLRPSPQLSRLVPRGRQTRR